MKLTATQKTGIIAVTAIGVNVFEAILVPNFVEKKLDRSWKFEMPPARTVIQTLAILTVTAFIGGMIATYALDKLDDSEAEAQALAEQK